MTPHRRTVRRALGATAVLALAGACITAAAPAQAANPADGPGYQGHATVNVPDVRAPKTGCTTVTMKVRIAVEGDLPWYLYNGVGPDHDPSWTHHQYGDAVTGRNDAHVKIRFRICAGAPAGAWTGAVALVVNGNTHDMGGDTDPFTVRPAKR
jgi:hypothetical protein